MEPTLLNQVKGVASPERLPKGGAGAHLNGVISRLSLIWRTAFAALALIAADLAAAAGYGAYAAAATQPPSVYRDVDAAIVFFADSAEGDRARLVMGMDFLRRGEAQNLYFVGGARRTGSGSMRQAAAAVARGAPPARVGADRTSFDTQTNIASACDAIDAKGWRRVALVSDAMHIVRIRFLISRSACAATESVPAPTPASGFGETWCRAHYEAVAWGVDVLLPEAARTWLVRQLRR